MKYTRFEELPVWKAAARFYVGVETLVEDAVFRGHGDLKSQLLRASLSVSNNGAEGFERGTTNELLMFIYIARGSAGECRSMLQVMLGSPRYRHLKSQCSDLRSQSESISKQLHGWAESLQNSDIKGQRHLNDATREHYGQRQRAETFTAQIRAVVAEQAREREEEEARRETGNDESEP